MLTTAMSAPRSNIGRRITRLLCGVNGDAPPSRRLRLGVAVAAVLVVLTGGVLQSSLSAPVPPQSSVPQGYIPTPGEFESAFATSRNKTGPLESDLQVIEFSDFECPACRRANNPRPWRSAWPQIRVQFRHLPLTAIHPHALSAAQLAEERAVKGDFWKTHDFLFAGKSLRSQIKVLSTPRMPTPAERKAALSRNQDAEQEKRTFIQAVQETNRVRERIVDRIERDQAQAKRWAVDATPTYFVLDRRDNKVRRFTGYTALAAFLESATAPLTPPRRTSAEPQKPRITLELRQADLESSLKHVLQRAKINYVVDPRLNLSGAYVTMRVQDMEWPEVLERLRAVSPVPFEVQFLDDKNAIVKPVSTP